MARIPEEELARLKATVDLAQLVRASGVELAPVGEDLRGRCPFHQDDTPSLVVTPAKALWHCFGCDLGGSAVDWVMRTQGLSFRHAVEVLRAGLAAPASPGVVKHSLVRRLPPPVSLDADDQALLNQVVAYYHETLKASPEALAYLQETRGLRSAEMVERFKLGFSNRTLGLRVPMKAWKAGGELRGRLAALGILRESGHEHFRGCVVFPIMDETGNVLGIYGRRITSARNVDLVRHLYLKGPHRGVWNVEALSASREVVLCEAALDALTFWCAGLRNVTWSYGVNGFTEDHLAAFLRYGVERVLIAYDRDEAGDAAAEALAPRLAEAGMDVYRVLFPRGMDANEYARKVTPASESLGVVLRSAQFVLKGRRVAATAPPPAAVPTAGPEELAAPPADTAPSRPSEDLGAARPKVVVDPPAAPAFEEAARAAAKGESGEGLAPSPTAPPHEGEDLGAASTPALAVAPSSEPLPLAAPSPAASEAPSLMVNGDQADLVVGDRAYRVGNLTKNLSPNAMRVTLRVSRGEKVHVDTLELLSDRARQLYIKRAADELGVEPETVKKDLGKLLLALELLQERRIEKVLTPKEKGVQIPEEEKAEAFAFLRDPRLLARVVLDLDRVGLVGEETNKLVGYLAATSRKLSEPLAVLVQSNSAAGKSALMDAVLELMPPEDVERYTAMTGQSLYYLADTSLKHKVLAIAEVAGAERAGYAIKMLQSEGKISIATTVKDPDTGEMKTKKHEVEGPVAVFLTTTEATIDEELQNRAVVLTVNEDRAQTRAIHEAQRRSQTLAGILAREERQAVVRLHRNAQRLLRPLRVVNPHADRLTFLDAKLRTRRDHVKYLTLIQAIALLHQYQRPILQMNVRGNPVPYIETTLSDIETAHRLAEEVFGQSLDEMAPQTRRLLLLIDEMVTKQCASMKLGREDLRFTRREVREYTKWGHSQLCVHLERLVELEMLLVHNGKNGRCFTYELLYDGKGKDGRPFLVGLLDVDALRYRYDGQLPGENGDLPGRFRPASGPLPGTFRPPENGSGRVHSPP